MLVDNLKPLPRLPSRFRPEHGEPLPDGIIGSTVVGFGGAPASADLEGGGLVIDYIPAGKKKTMRAVFSFTELGMWVESLKSLRTPSSRSSAREG